MALAHTLGSKVEAIYNQGDLLEKRRGLMQEWSSFLHAYCPALSLCSSELASEPASMGDRNLPQTV